MSARRITVRRRGLALRVDVRVLTVIGVLAAATLLAFTVHLSRGEFPISPGDVIATLAGAGDSATEFIVLDLRLPRALTAIFAGAALGIAGTIFQDLARNPLVSPDVVGITGGASFAAVSAIILFDADGAFTVPLAALAGAIAAGLALYLLAWRSGVQGYRFVLVGIGVAALTNAGVSWVLTEGGVFEVARAYVWLVGSLNGSSWQQFWPLATTVVVLFPLALVLARQLEVLQLGDDLARSLGVRVERARLGLLAVALVLTAVAVAATGAIAFAAFIAPHIARRLSGSVSPAAVLPVAAGSGALLVLVSDLAARLLFGAAEFPVGIVTSVLAAPYFLYLLHRANRLGVPG